MKKLVKLIVVLLIVVVVLAIAGVWKLDAIAKAAIEKGGSYALGTETTVKKVHLGLLSGEATLNRLEVDNPTGFPADHPLMRSGDFAVKLDTATITKPVIVIPSITLDGLVIHLDRADNRYNVQAISDNLKKFSSQKTKEKPKTDKTKPAKKYVVKKLLITNVTGQADLPTGMSVPIKIDKIELADITSDEGVAMSDLIGQLFPAIMGSVVNGIGQLPGELANLITNDLAGAAAALGGNAKALLDSGIQNIKAELAGKVEQVGQQAGKAVGNVTKGIGDTLKGIGSGGDKSGDSSDEQKKDPLKSIGEGLGGLLGGDKNK